MSKTTFFKDLGKRDKKHLVEMGIQTLGAFRRNAEEQRQMRLAHPESEPCFECKAIALKLGVAVLTENQAYVAIRDDGFVDGACFTESAGSAEWCREMKASGIKVEVRDRAEAKRILFTTLA